MYVIHRRILFSWDSVKCAGHEVVHFLMVLVASNLKVALIQSLFVHFFSTTRCNVPKATGNDPPKSWNDAPHATPLGTVVAHFASALFIFLVVWKVFPPMGM